MFFVDFATVIREFYSMPLAHMAFFLEIMLTSWIGRLLQAFRQGLSLHADSSRIQSGIEAAASHVNAAQIEQVCFHSPPGLSEFLPNLVPCMVTIAELC